MFKDCEIATVVKNMGTDMVARLTPYGNIVIKHKDSVKPFFVFYKRGDEVIIRRRTGYENPFGGGNILNNGKPFNNIADAMIYFLNYKVKYANSLK